jgi:hypothetical protein
VKPRHRPRCSRRSTRSLPSSRSSWRLERVVAYRGPRRALQPLAIAAVASWCVACGCSIMRRAAAGSASWSDVRADIRHPSRCSMRTHQHDGPAAGGDSQQGSHHVDGVKLHDGFDPST